MKGVRPQHLRTLLAVGTIDKLAHRDHLFADLDSALAHARTYVRQLLRSEV